MANREINAEVYLNNRSQTLSICKPLEIEDYVVQPVPEVSPPKWHLGHTTWFFENFILKQYVVGYEAYDPNFDELFNSYYKSCGKHWLQGKRGILSRPTVAQVLDYRNHVDEQMVQLLNASHDEDDNIRMLAEVGIHHEQQHQELLFMDIKYVLAVNPCMPTFNRKPLPSIPESAFAWINIEPDLYLIGTNSQDFTYDNERPAHQYYQHHCSLGERLITNGEYLQFIEDKGYENPLLWLSDGWNWLQENQITSPLYWYEKDGVWFEFTLHGNQPLDKSLPVCHISYYEAKAYATWVGARLPTEQELEIYLVKHALDNDGHEHAYSHPHQIEVRAGQLWAWTQSSYLPYPGYQAYEGALGEYNGKFMCNQQVLRGGCVATPKGHYRPSYRNFYFPHQQWMFSGICLAKDM